MRIFALIFLGLASFLHLYLAWDCFRAFRDSRWQAAHYLILGIFTFFLILLHYRREMWSWHYGPYFEKAMFIWLGFLILVNLSLLVRDGIAIGAAVSDLFLNTSFRNHLHARATIPYALLAGALAFGYSLYEANKFRIMKIDVSTNKLAAGMDTVRVVAMTDLHITDKTPVTVLERIVDAVNAQNADYVAIVGDFLDTYLDPDGPHARELRRIQATYGKFAVYGNHELYRGLQQSGDFIQGAGFTLLRGAADNRGPISVVGVDDPQIHGRIGIPEALTEAEQDRFVLLLSHRPETPDDAAGLFDLEVSGHTHGGQIWPARLVVRYITNFGNGFKQGVNRLDGSGDSESIVYVSNGTRHWGPPVRFLTPPEVTVFDIVQSRSHDNPST